MKMEQNEEKGLRSTRLEEDLITLENNVEDIIQEILFEKKEKKFLCFSFLDMIVF
jgi:hypothetical protein